MLLAIDTSTAQVGLALYDGARLAAEMIWHSPHHHTVELAPALVELFRRTGLGVGDVQALGVAIGPGSFTSLRVGLAFAKGLALARRRPLIGVCTLDVLAAAQPPSRAVLIAVLQAGRGRMAVGRYKSVRRQWKPLGEPHLTTLEALAASIEGPAWMAGELSPQERQWLARKKHDVSLAPPSLCVRRPSLLAELAWVRWQENRVDEPASLAPVYLQVNALSQA